MAGGLEPIRGVIAPTLTPFDHDLSIAQKLFADHAQHLLEAGCAGLAPFGTTGEALSLGIEERMAALDYLIDRGVDPKKLIPGTGLTNLPDTIRLTRHAVERGCAGALVRSAFRARQATRSSRTCRAAKRRDCCWDLRPSSAPT